MPSRSQSKPIGSTQKDVAHFARNRRRAWFALAAAVEDAQNATDQETRRAASNGAFRALERLRNLGVPRADPIGYHRPSIDDLAPHLPTSPF